MVAVLVAACSGRTVLGYECSCPFGYSSDVHVTPHHTHTLVSGSPDQLYDKQPLLVTVAMRSYLWRQEGGEWENE